MSDTETNKDSTQAAVTKAADKPSKKTTGHKAAKKHHPVLTASIIFLLVIGATVAGLWQFNKKQQSNLAHQFTAINEQIDQLNRAQRYQSDDQQAQLNTLDESQQELKRNFASLLKNSAHLRNDWLLAEAEYLVKLANHRLILEKDINTAITALEAADDRLKEVADPALLEVRKVLLEQVQSLRSIVQPDITGMALRISALKKEVAGLPMQTPDPATVHQREKLPSNASQVKDWRDLPSAMWNDLKNLLVIRDHSQAVQPLIPPEQHYFLVQNINLQLEQARYALLKGNNSLYVDSLSSARQWVENYFDTRQQPTQTMVDTINKLLEKNIEPVIPDISQSFKVLQQYREKNTVRSETPATDKTSQTKQP